MRHMCDVCETKGGCSNNDARVGLTCVMLVMLNKILSSLDIEY